MVRPSETASQRARRLLGARFDKTWPNTRSTRRPRGLKNPDAYCYRNSALQMLVHLPKFVNWILQHNDPVTGQDWPCHPNDPNRRLPVQQVKDKAITDMDPDLINGCVPCRLKNFIQDYWGDSPLDTDQNPSDFPDIHPSILPLHKMGERWNCQLPPPKKNEKPHAGETDMQFIARRLQRETGAQRRARVRKATGQSCADEFMSFIHEGIKHSIDPSNQTRLDQYNALCMLQRHEETRCDLCNCARGDQGHRDYVLTRDVGLSNIRPLSSGPDDLHSALARSTWLTPETNDALTCQCKRVRATTTRRIEAAPETNDAPICPCNHVGATTTRRIEAAPEYLRVHLDLSIIEGNKMTGVKNRAPLEIPDIVDLTAHAYAPDAGKQPWPLRYKLVSVLYHAGENTSSGHWTAGVSCPIPKAERAKHMEAVKGARKRKRAEAVAKVPSTSYHFCNDGIITEWQTIGDENPLTENPYITEGRSEMNAVVLMYERLPRVPDYAGELESSLNKKYYDVGKKELKNRDDDAKKRKETDGVDERGLRRSKRLKAKK